MRINMKLGLAIVLVPSFVAVTLVAQDAPASVTQKLYLAQCSKCHGPDGTPRPIAKKAPRFMDPAWAPPLEKIQDAITNGKGEVMPKFKGRLSPDEVRGLANYVLTLKNK